MTQNRGLSSSEQYIKKSNRRLLIAGGIIAVVFLFALIMMADGGSNRQEVSTLDYRDTLAMDETFTDLSVDPFARGQGELSVEPKTLTMDNVVIGSKVEAVLTLTALETPILYYGATLAESGPDGFTIETTCPENGVIEANSACTVKVLWNPVSLRQIQNNLTIEWKENSDTAFDKQKTTVQIKAQSTDSKDCIICEAKEDNANIRQKQALGVTGKLYAQSDDGSIKIKDKSYQKTENGLYLDENGAILAVAEPERMALSLKNKLLGKIAKNGDVTDEQGKNVGRLLGDNTIVDNELTVLGYALPVVSVMNENGKVIGKMTPNATIVNGQNEVIANPIVDGSAKALDDSLFGFSSAYGYVVDFTGAILGVIIPDGSVINADNQVVANVMPNGLAFDKDGVLVGGTFESGVAVGKNGQSLGNVALDGKVVDSYNQIAGRALIDGAVVDNNGSEIGQVISQTLVINERSKIIGFINSEGKAISAKGALIGTVHQNGTVLAGVKNIGSVLPHGRVIGYGCTQVGSVYPNASVMSMDGDLVGLVRPDKYVKDKNNKIVGVVVDRAAAVADGCRLLGLVSITGDVLDKGVKTGCMTPDYTVIDNANQVIGSIAKKGNVYNQAGKIIGRARLDGKVVDAKNTVVGCIGLNNVVTSLTGEIIGSVGAVDTVKNQNGIVFSIAGEVIGRYSAQVGYALNNNEEKLGQVLPDLTVVDVNKGEIIGAVIPNASTFMDMNNQYIGAMALDGTVQNANGAVIGKIRADGSLVDDNGAVVGGLIKTGTVYSPLGAISGFAKQNGVVYSIDNTEIGVMTISGLAVNKKGDAIGGILSHASLAVNADGVMGTVNQNGKVINSKGNTVGKATPFGLVIDLNNAVVGAVVSQGAVVNDNNKLIGSVAKSGDVVDLKGNTIAKILPNGVAYGADQKAIGALVKKGIAISAKGEILSFINPKNTLLSKAGVLIGKAGSNDFVYDDNDKIMGKIITPGVGVASNGAVLGALRSDGAVGSLTEIKGYITFDNRIVSKDNKIIGHYVPFNSIAVNNKGKTIGLVSVNGQLKTTMNTPVGKALNATYVTQNGNTVARLVDNTYFVSHLTQTALDTVMTSSGNTVNLADNKLNGSVMMNGFAIDLAKNIVGAIMPMGSAVTNTLSHLGQELLTGAVLSDVANNIAVSANGALYNKSNSLVGQILPMTTFIDRTGMTIGMSTGVNVIATQSGEKVATQMPFGTALTANNMWAGGAMPVGTVIDDDGKKIGMTTSAGTVLNDKNAVVARVLSDGAAASISSADLYNVMPYAGAVVKQGLPYSYKNEVLGRTTVKGDIINAMDNKMYTSLDDATVLSQKDGLVGAVLPFLPVISHSGQVLGTLNGTGHVMSVNGDDKGKIAVNQVLKSGKYQIIGGMIPERVIVKDCQVVGQTSLNGQVVDAQGRVVGRILPDRTVVSSQGEIIGREARSGIVMSPDGAYLGRTLPDSTIADEKGVSIGCVKNDGTAVDTAGKTIGALVERGLVLGLDGKPLGRVKADGSVVDKDGKVIGTVLANGNVVDSEGNVIGNALSKNQELIYDENGNIQGVFDNSGVYRDPKTMQEAFRVDKDGNVYDANGNLIAKLKDGEFYTSTGDKLDDLTVLKDKNGNVFGVVSGCDVLNSYGEKIGTIRSDGKVVDLNNETFAIIRGDGTILDKDGNEMGAVQGTNVKLDRCGIQSVSTGGAYASSGKGIFIGDKMYTINEKGSILNDEGIVIGYMGEDGKPYTLDNRQLTASGDLQGRSRPSFANRPTVTTEQIAQMKSMLDNKRELMRSLRPSSIIMPSKKIEALARKQEDTNWKSLGINKNVSSYKVNMSRMILKDKAIPAVLTRSVDSRFTSVPISAVVERHIYAESGRNIIIPAGSRVIGKLDSSGGSGQKVAKMDIIWTRLIRPDGGTFVFEASSGDAQGRGGVAAYLDDQLVQKYGTPLASSILTSATSYMMAVNEDVQTNADTGTTVTSSKSEAASDARESFINTMDQIFNQLITDSADVPEVTFVPAGTRITIFSNEDLWLRSETEDVEDVEDELGSSDKQAQVPAVNSWVDTRTQNTGASASTDTMTPPVKEVAKESSSDKSVIANVVEHTDESYYQPTSTTQTPLYDGTKDAIETRKVSPLMPKQSGGSSQLF